MERYLPVLLIVISNIFYNVCSKSTPEKLDPFASLTVTYSVGAAVSALLYFLTSRGGNMLAEWKQTNWTTYVLGLSIVGLEAGSIAMYKAGWNISTGHLFHSSILAVCLLFVGLLFYNETITWTKGVGILVCLAGLVMINRS